MNFGWEEVHEVAEQIEHIHAPKFFERMDEILGYPSVDPHGSPIPDRYGNLEKQSFQPLTAVLPGQRAKLHALTNSSTAFLAYLNSKALTLGSSIEIISIEQFDQSRVVRYTGHPTETLTEKVCERLLVQLEVTAS